MTEPASLVDSIYEAAVVPDLWPDVLDAVNRMSGTAWSAAVSIRGGDARWLLSDPRADAVVSAHFGDFAGNRRTTRFVESSPFGFVTDHDLLTQAEIDAEPLYQELLIPQGFGYGVGTILSLPDGDVVALHSEGLFRNGPVARQVVERLNALRPHLARAVLLSARLSFERTRTAVETLSAIGLAACGVARSGAVLLANAQFDAEQELLTTRGGDRIALHDPRAHLQLNDALQGLEQGGTRSIPLLPQAEGQLPAVLHVVPVRLSARDVFNHVAAILVMTKAASTPIRANSLLQALFDLTPTEAALAARVASGQSVEAVALADGKTPGTVRTQLKGVMSKTGCRRQAELARLLTQIVPAGM